MIIAAMQEGRQRTGRSPMLRKDVTSKLGEAARCRRIYFASLPAGAEKLPLVSLTELSNFEFNDIAELLHDTESCRIAGYTAQGEC
jgi:hypothetical protein